LLSVNDDQIFGAFGCIDRRSRSVETGKPDRAVAYRTAVGQAFEQRRPLRRCGRRLGAG
jgi:hypothetical protein